LSYLNVIIAWFRFHTRNVQYQTFRGGLHAAGQTTHNGSHLDKRKHTLVRTYAIRNRNAASAFFLVVSSSMKRLMV